MSRLPPFVSKRIPPPTGSITLSKLSVRYRPELPLALNSVSCVIPSQAKVGVVGRTGSGKSTFLAALWRLIEPEGGLNGDGFGAITIDGVDIRKLQLPALRSKLAIIPQDPILFNESLRWTKTQNSGVSSISCLKKWRLLHLLSQI